MAFIWHINFHTFRNKPVFENPEYEAFVRNTILEIAREKEIPLLKFEMMPTHVHLITMEFPDFPRSKMIQHLKGESSLRFFEKYPDCRYDLGGGHLWQISYDKVLITTHIQYRKTAEYVRNQKKWWRSKPQVEI
jgi:REP element-mobilizing transposase RayT